MSIASSAQADAGRRINHRFDMVRVLIAAGVPDAGLPPRSWAFWMDIDYAVRSPLPGGVAIEVLLIRNAFSVPYPVGLDHGVLFPWRDDAAQAWEHAKRCAGW